MNYSILIATTIRTTRRSPILLWRQT